MNSGGPYGRLKNMAAAAALLVALGMATDARGNPASLMIWPIHPVIRSDERAAALWLENRGTRPVTVQVRVFAWLQEEYADRYEDQPDALIPSPPLATIAPGRRQLVRLTRLVEAPAGQETAYRVLGDELPDAERDAAATDTGPQTALGVKLRMRYSLPLFVYGRGLEPATMPAAADHSIRPQPPAASWRVVEEGARRWLQVTNHGRHHLRLSHVRFVRPIEGFDLAPGLLGYVLPGATMRWPVPAEAPAGDGVTLEARVNGAPALTIARR